MSKFHSTVSRRDFMKGLGLAGAGLGAAAAAAPVFHDLDEAMASQSVSQKREWFIKELELEKPTLEIDWDVYQRYDTSATMFAQGFAAAVGTAERTRLRQLRSDREAKHMIDKTPGYNLRDRAMYQSIHREGISASFVGDKKSRTPQQWGDRADPPLTIPRWEGTPEENSRMIRSALKFRGAALVGFAELTANTRKLIFKNGYEFEDVDEAYQVSGKRVIPNKARWVISYAVPESEELVRRMPTALAEGAVFMAYSYGRICGGGMQNFLRGIGYQGVGAGDNSMAPNPGFAALTGIGEMSRAHQGCYSPELGSSQRTFKLITDLPLAPTKPIDVGFLRYCRTCKKCADLCPGDALSFDDDPTWVPAGTWNNPGQKAYPYSGPKCYTFWHEITTGCGLCMAVCPWAHKHTGGIHKLVLATLATTPLFNGFLKEMDDFFGYGFPPDQEAWWDLDTPINGIYTEGKPY